MTAGELLKKYYGYDSFREGQEKLINCILNGRDCLGIMPTGAGKSVCFQIPAMMKDGITLVISPLISLMKDQVNSLTQNGIPAAYINSSLDSSRLSQVLQNTRNGVYRLIYVAPERLTSYEFLEIVDSVDVSMITVDEAHCISQWGHDFRPSYAKIPEFISRLPRRPVISAFTATATEAVRDDIVSLLGLQDPYIVTTGFDRKNLYFEVRQPAVKFDALLACLNERSEKSGIIYCSTRNNVDKVCERLNKNGYKASRYHAGLSDAERRTNQEDFIYDRVKIMVATNAFGMGIDKSNVSYVIHYNMPKDMESYYQEAGRAGRDGANADCILFYSRQDVVTNRMLIKNSPGAPSGDEEQAELLKKHERKRLNDMASYCVTNECLRSRLLEYFGERTGKYCGNCSNCNAEYEEVDITLDAQKILSCVYRMKESFGECTVIDVLLGSKGKKIVSFELNKLSTYGIYPKGTSKKDLLKITNELLLLDYLVKTNDKYPLLKLGSRARSVLFGGDRVIIKRKKEAPAVNNAEEVLKKTKSLGKENARSGAGKPIRAADKELFELLRELRYKIASDANVPSFVIFSDSTLMDMCLKLPKTQEEMLNVSGVGQVKYQRYGLDFQNVIASYLDKKAASAQTEPDRDAECVALNKYEIPLSRECVTIGAVTDRINSYLLASGKNKLRAVTVNDWLISCGILEKTTLLGKQIKAPTKKGLSMGLTTEQREKGRGKYIVVEYNVNAQKYIIDNLENLLEFTQKAKK